MNEPWSLDVELLKLVGLDFGTDDLDAFATVRQADEISIYASRYREAIATSRTGDYPEQELLVLLGRALYNEITAERAQGAFSTSGSVANIVWLIPLAVTLRLVSE